MEIKKSDAGVMWRQFVYGTDLFSPDYLIDSTGSVRIIKDHLGSPRLLVKVTDGTVMQRMDYDEFGRVTANTNPTYQPFGFAGGLYLRLPGLVNFGARYYDPETGRWTTKDPSLFNGGDANLYGYIANDPVNDIDPSGLYALCTRRLSALPGKFGPLYHVYICVGDKCAGQGTSGNIFGSEGVDDSKGADACQITTDACMDKCIEGAIASPARPKYSMINVGGINCQKWVGDILNGCRSSCGGK